MFSGEITYKKSIHQDTHPIWSYVILDDSNKITQYSILWETVTVIKISTFGLKKNNISWDLFSPKTSAKAILQIEYQHPDKLLFGVFTQLKFWKKKKKNSN